MEASSAASTPPATAPSGNWKSVVGALASVVLGGVLLFAVFAKVLDPVAFAEEIAHQGLDFVLPAHVMVYVALGIEALLGFLLLFGVRRLWVLIPATLLVLFFLFLTGKTWYLVANGLAMPSGCGCFGNLVERTPSEAFWWDLALLLPPALLSWLGRPKGPAQPMNRLGLAGVATVATLMFAWMSPSMPWDDLATKLQVGTNVAEICAGTGKDKACLSGPKGIIPDLTEGKHLVIITATDEQMFLDAIPRLNEQLMKPEPLLWVVTMKEKDEIFHLEFRGASFSPEIAPPSMLRPLYRSLPRSFLVEDGIVLKTWASGRLPPLPTPGE